MFRIHTTIVSLALACFVLTAFSLPAQTLVWAEKYASSDGLSPVSSAMDGNGNIVTVGDFDGSGDLDPGAGVFAITNPSPNHHNTYIQKLDSSGHFLWGGTLGSISGNYPQTVALDPEGGIYVFGGGSFLSDFDPGPGVDSVDLTDYGIYILHLDPHGHFLWVKTIAHGAFVAAATPGFVLDGQGNMYVRGTYIDTIDVDLGVGTQLIFPRSFDDGFFAKYDTLGQLAWAHTLSAPWDQDVTAIAADASGLYMAGSFQDTVDFDPGPGTAILSNAPNQRDGFVAHYDAAGNFMWVSPFACDTFVSPTAMALLPNGDVVVGGAFQGNMDVDPGSGTQWLGSATAADLFVLRLAANGSLLWADAWGGLGNEATQAIAPDVQGNLFVAADFSGNLDIDPGPNVLLLSPASPLEDIAVLKLDAAGNFLDVSHIGGMAEDVPRNVMLDPQGNIFVTGSFGLTMDFAPEAPDTFLLTAAQTYEAFVLKWRPTGTVTALDGNLNNPTGLRLVPNPASQAVTLVAPVPLQEILIVNASGATMLRMPCESTQYTVDLQGLAPGMYHVRAAGLWRRLLVR